MGPWNTYTSKSRIITGMGFGNEKCALSPETSLCKPPALSFLICEIRRLKQMALNDPPNSEILWFCVRKPSSGNPLLRLLSFPISPNASRLIKMGLTRRDQMSSFRRGGKGSLTKLHHFFHLHYALEHPASAVTTQQPVWPIGAEKTITLMGRNWSWETPIDCIRRNEIIFNFPGHK